MKPSSQTAAPQHDTSSPSTSPSTWVEHKERWNQLCARWLPDLDEVATSTGAIERVETIARGSDLLRLLMAYRTANLSFRSTSAWARTQLHIAMTDEGLRQKFLQCEAFLLAVLGALLQPTEQHARRASGPSLRIIDGTMLSCEGSHGTDYRVMVTYDASQSRCVGVVLTDDQGSEQHAHAAAAPFDVVLGDRAYGLARDIHDALTRGVHPIFRVYLPNLRVTDDAGNVLTVEDVLDEADGGQIDREVWVPLKGHTRRAIRLLVVPLPREQAARARQTLHARERKKGRTPSDLSMRLAGYRVLATSLPREIASVEFVAQTYGLRWQVELFLSAVRACSDSVVSRSTNLRWGALSC